MKKLLWLCIPLKAGLIPAVFFTLTVAHGQYNKLLDFTGAANGSNPYGSLISDGTFLYGLTYGGGTNGEGVIFKIKPDGTGYSDMHDFTGYPTDGNKPYGSLISVGSFLYGMTNRGGANDAGTIFKIKPDGTGFVTVLDFGGTINAGSPLAALFYDGTYLYGTTSSGGINNDGIIFKVKPDGTGFVKLLDFMGPSNGSFPHCSLISDGVFLYGTTDMGGSNGWGTIFKIKPDGTGYVKLKDFGGTAVGTYPFGSLFYDGTYLYGTTSGSVGVNNGWGMLFKIKTDGTGYSNLHDFIIGTDGTNPHGELISLGGFLYGLTRYGGTSTNCGMDACGTVFKIKSDGTAYSTVLSFANDTVQGYNPYGSLFSDGTYLYGMTYSGGTNDLGTIFKINPTGMGVTENEVANNISLSQNPFSTQTVLQTNNLLFNATLTVDNCFGQTVKQFVIRNSSSFVIRRDNLPSGLYFIRLTEDNKLFTGKLVITDN